VKVMIRHIEARTLLPPLMVLQALAPNRHLQLGVVKVGLTNTHHCAAVSAQRPANWVCAKSCARQLPGNLVPDNLF